jgi:formate dehydrogenase subunit gamma
MLFRLPTARAALVALAMTLGLGLAAPALAQHGQDPKPSVQTTNPNARNPTAEAVSEDALLRQLQGGSHIGGRVSIPDRKASILEQPQGRDYRQFREGYLPWIGGIAVLGMILALAAFYFTRGRIRLDHSEESGRKILRFNAFERFTHWLTAMCFIVLAISGLNYIFGKRLLLPIIGADAFAAWSQYAKFAHNYLSWPFMIGLVLMILVWIATTFPTAPMSPG